MTMHTAPSTHSTDEPGHAGSMSAGDHHDPADHGADGGHDDHAHLGSLPLGPIDVPAWGAGALGLLLGLAVALCFAAATGGGATV